MKTQKKSVIASRTASIEYYLKRIFTLMFAAVGITGLASYTIMHSPMLMGILFTSPLFYILVFGGLALSIWAQARAFSIKPATAALCLFLYAILIGIVITPLIVSSLAVAPWSIILAFAITALMFACMAIFGYKTIKNLSGLGVFLFIGMIGLILVGVASIFWHELLGGTFGTIVCLIGVLVFALFTAYDMQNLKRAYAMIGDETQGNQLAVLGALHLYISFIAMFQYILSLFNRN